LVDFQSVQVIKAVMLSEIIVRDAKSVLKDYRVSVLDQAVLTMAGNSVLRVKAREMMTDLSCPQARVQRFLFTLDILSGARVSMDSTIADGGIIQKCVPPRTMQCGDKGQANLSTQASVFFPGMNVKLRPFASRLSAINDVGLYYEGDAVGYSQGCLDGAPLMSVALTQFDCAKPIKIHARSRRVIGFSIVEPGDELLCFHSSTDVCFQPVNFSFNTGGYVHCSDFRFGVCCVEGVIQIANHALKVEGIPAKVGDRYLFACDSVSKRWIIHDMDGPDRIFRLSQLYGRFGMKTSGYRIGYQFDKCGVTIGYQNLRVFDMIADRTRGTCSGQDIISQKVLQRLNSNLFGFEFVDHIATADDLRDVDFHHMLLKITAEENLEVREQYVDMLALIEADRIKQTQTVSVVKFKDAMLPVVTHCRAVLTEAVAVVDCQFEEMKDLSPDVEMGVRMPEVYAGDYRDIVITMLTKDVVEIVCQVPKSCLVEHVRSIPFLSKISNDYVESQVFLNISHFGYSERAMSAHMDYLLGANKKLIFVLRASKKWQTDNFNKLLGLLIRFKMRILTFLIGVSWSSYYCLIEADVGEGKYGSPSGYNG